MAGDAKDLYLRPWTASASLRLGSGLKALEAAATVAPIEAPGWEPAICCLEFHNERKMGYTSNKITAKTLVEVVKK